MIIGDHNPNILTQEFVLLMLNDRYPNMKINNCNAHIEYGDLSAIKNDRIVYVGHWTVHYDFDETPSIRADLFGAKIEFAPRGSGIETVTKTWFKYCGPASYWDAPDGTPSPKGTFWGFRVEIDNVPASTEMPPPQPTPEYEILNFWYVVDNQKLFAKGAVSGTDKMYCNFYVDDSLNGCYPLEISDVALTDTQMLLVHPAIDPCNPVGNAQNNELLFPNHYGVRLRFMSYDTNSPLYPSHYVVKYEIMQENPDLYFNPNTFVAVGVPFSIAVNANILTCRVEKSDIENWTNIQWKVSSSADPNATEFVHEFTRDIGFIPVNQVFAKWGTPSCSSPNKPVYMEKPYMALAVGLRVFITTDTTLYFPPEVTEIVDQPLGTRYQLLKEQRVGDTRAYNYIGSVLGTC